MGTSAWVFEGTYKVNGDKLTMNMPSLNKGADETGTYKINGNTLTITAPNGKTNSLTKK
jgi:hypothetical protein